MSVQNSDSIGDIAVPVPEPDIPPEESCDCCELCASAGDNQLVYCHQGTWHTLAAPDYAATLGFDPVTGFQWVPVLMAQKTEAKS